ncbi:MAG TPA: endo alpha-1,4 polygalactosaminidase [Labilithrix sp.]|nr:endo alpha-1,4 polygalactosaminidase [Labilithrix sp.]
MSTSIILTLAIAIAGSSACARRPSASRVNGSDDIASEDAESGAGGGARKQGASSDGREDDVATPAHMTGPTMGPGFPENGPWVSFYGRAAEMSDLARVARTYRIINIDADPGMGNFTAAELAQLRAGGRNRVLSYMNVGSCETFRTYWSTAPASRLSCAANRAAHLGPYEGYPDETWMDLGNADYQALLLEHVAPRLAARVDGFYLDNLELVEHTASSQNGPCSAACRQGGLDIVRKLRQKFPNHLIVMQNATGDVTRLGITGGIPFPLLLDGIAHEEVYAPTHDAGAEAELLAWTAMGLTSRSRHRFWIAVEDYVGSCRNTSAARKTSARARARGFSPYASDESGGQRVVCFWD